MSSALSTLTRSVHDCEPVALKRFFVKIAGHTQTDDEPLVSPRQINEDFKDVSMVPPYRY